MVPRASHTLYVCREVLKTSGFALGFQHFFKPAGILPAGYHDLPERTETDRNGPKRTETDRNGPKRTETDFRGYRNGHSGYRNGPERTETDRNGPKRTGTDFRGYRNRLSGYRIGL